MFCFFSSFFPLISYSNLLLILATMPPLLVVVLLLLPTAYAANNLIPRGGAPWPYTCQKPLEDGQPCGEDYDCAPFHHCHATKKVCSPPLPKG